MIITSKDNKTVKLLRSLSQKKSRDKSGLFVVEGVRAVTDVMAYSKELITEVIATADKADEFPEALIVDDEIFAKSVETENSQGVAAILKIPKPKQVLGDKVLFLDCLRDPGNIGTLIRTGCAAGFTDILLKSCADPYSGKVVRSTMSAIVKVNLLTASDKDLIDLRQRGYTVYGADMNGKNVFDVHGTDKMCVVVGGEANGITDEVLRICDEVISIPMNENIESLNAAVSGAIIMYTLKYNK